MVEATPMNLGQAENRGILPKSAGGFDSDPGYMVVYPDGYESWSPKDVFEAAYFPLAHEDGTKIVDEDIEKFMGGAITTKQLDEKTTLVQVDTLTGFRQYEVSSCVDPKNYDHEMGKTIALERIKNKVWPCLGFVLQWAKNGLKGA